MTPFLRCWLFPGWMRRLPHVAQIVLTIGAVFLVVFVSVTIVRMSRTSIVRGPLTVPAFAFVFGLPGALSVMALAAGATLIAGERQKQTWEPLLAAPIPIQNVVAVKLLARTVFCMILALPPTVWVLSILFVLIRENGFRRAYDTPTPAVLFLRIAPLLAWTALQLLCRLIPFLAIGAAISARCRKVNDALLFVGAVIVTYAVVLWQLIASDHGYDIINPSRYGIAMTIFRWPVMPYLTGNYPSEITILPSGWQVVVAADLIWITAIPLVFTLIAIHWSRPSTKSQTPAKLGA